MTVRDPVRSDVDNVVGAGRLTRWNSGTDGESPDGRSSASATALGQVRRTLSVPRPGVRTDDEKGTGGMFTGIVEERGQVVAVDDLGDSIRIAVRAPLVTADAKPGDSIAVNGCCLTVVGLDDDVFTADVMRESLRRTSLSAAAPGVAVNLERAVPAHGRMGGHLVQGHVDGTATLRTREHSTHWDVVTVEVPSALSRYLAPQGSIALDGVSLTVVDVLDGTELAGTAVTVSLIPTTLAATTLGERRPGDSLNVEVDVIAKYVERLLAHPAGEEVAR